MADNNEDQKTVVGINFGDSYASIAVINKESQAECIANEDGERQIASMVSYSGQEIYIGNGARPQLVKNYKNTIAHFRNLLGKKFSAISTSQPTSDTSAPVKAGADDTPSYTVTVLTPPPAVPVKSSVSTPIATPRPSSPTPTEKTLTVPEVTTLFLDSLRQSAVDFLGKPIDGAVISVPTWFDANAKAALKKASEDAGMRVLQLLEEPGAVALAYMALEEKRAVGEDKTTLILDLGANSLTLSLLAIKQGLVHTLASLYDPTVGGSSIDTLLINHFAKEFTKKTKIPLSFPASTPEDKRAEAKLRLAVEHTKRTLSASAGPATCSVESLKDGFDFSGSITRVRFDLLVSSVYKRVAEKVNEILAQAGKDIALVHDIILIGASASLTGLADELQASVIKSEEEGATVVRSDIETYEVIARGAALQAQLLTQVAPEDFAAEFADETALTEVVTQTEPIGLVFVSGEGRQLVRVVDNDVPLPARRIVRFGVDASKAKTVAFEVWEVKDIVKVSKGEAPPKLDDDDEDEEPEEIRTRDVEYTRSFGGLSLDLTGTGKTKVLVKVELGVSGSMEVKVWEEGKDGGAKVLTV